MKIPQMFVSFLQILNQMCDFFYFLVKMYSREGLRHDRFVVLLNVNYVIRCLRPIIVLYWKLQIYHSFMLSFIYKTGVAA